LLNIIEKFAFKQQFKWVFIFSIIVGMESYTTWKMAFLRLMMKNATCVLDALKPHPQEAFFTHKDLRSLIPHFS